VAIAKGQLKEGAHILDVCVAYVGRNETRDMEEFLKRAVTQVNIPIMIDSTEAPVIEKALQIAPGKCIVNSFNFEDGEGKARKVLELCKEYGAAVVALTIDETGMAKTLEHKKAVVDRIVALACGEYGIPAQDLVIDPLTFTLGSGDEEFRASALATLDGIRYVKERHPGVQTILGLSNVSFGLSPYPRQILNSLMLYHAVKAGLDMAILNASKIIPVARIEPEDARIAEDLLYDRRKEGYDPLKAFLARFEDGRKAGPATADERASLSIDERLKRDIIDGEKALIAADALEALKERSPLSIINDVLLDGMRVVGERFGAGEMQLPFVLESAEAMKLAVKTLEPYMEKSADNAKGRMLLATVKGDVHDIGKNLVEIILSNNGYEVVNLGIKQPIESILEKYKDLGAGRIDCIGLSGLLVKSTVIMKENLEYMASRGYTVPVVLGGAALTRAFVEEDCQAVYPGPVLYAGDAFDGLRYMERIAAAKARGETPNAAALRAVEARVSLSAAKEDATPQPAHEVPPADAQAVGLRAGIKVVRKGDSKVGLDAHGQSTWVRRTEPVPTPPFFGVQTLDISVADAFAFLDEFALVRSRWGFQQGNMDDAAFQRVLEEKAHPTLEKWRARLLAESILHPKAAYGYFPACSQGDTVLVYAPGTLAHTPPEKREILARFPFPRQTSGRQLCIADFYRHENSGELDVLGVQLVTMGEEASAVAARLYEAQDFTNYFYFHGLATELTEACAERIHKRIRTELGAAGRDATSIRQLFSQGYQGSRYSFGYPACPDMELNAPLLTLLGAERIGVHLSESFQMAPEQSTSAIVTVHPQARYFST
jgi:5-methyltetrahydrofolate--homocysteine methyltransferase